MIRLHLITRHVAVRMCIWQRANFIREGLIKSESHGSIHLPFVPSAARSAVYRGCER